VKTKDEEGQGCLSIILIVLVAVFIYLVVR